MNKEHGELIDHLSEPANGEMCRKCDTNSIKISEEGTDGE